MVGALSTSTLIVADIGHAIAHIVSARYAGAPMDEILVSPGMPRTIYFDNDVPPQAHRMRALGGPIYSALGLLSSLVVRGLAPRDSAVHEIAGWSCVGHGFIFAGSLAPLPIVDGGSILKWTLVEQGRTPAEADEVVKRVNLAMGGTATTAGLVLAARRRWFPGLGLIGAGVIAIGAALGRIR